MLDIDAHESVCISLYDNVVLTESLYLIASFFELLWSEGERRGLKRKTDDDSGGYNRDDEGEKSKNEVQKNQTASNPEVVTSAATGPATSKGGKGATGSKKKKLDDSKREERNAREKERSFRISKQINELRTLLSSGGVIVPKGTKSSVLTEAANYIRMLQQHQYRSEMWVSLCSSNVFYLIENLRDLFSF